MAPSNESLEDLIQRWLDTDKNAVTREEIVSLKKKNDTAELEKRLRERIVFGTAGLRAPMEAGFSRMNDVTVLQASQGLLAYLLQHPEHAVQEKGIVIGHDHRNNSARFARLAANVFLSGGVKTYLYRGHVHTPMVPFGVLRLGTAAGIMITASHNPAKDNGYKLYASNGVQIIPPEDMYIEASIRENLAIPDELWNIDEVEKRCGDKTEEMAKAYIEMVKEMTKNREHNSKSETRFVYTPMHGVGLPFAKAAISAFGFDASKFIPVPEQAHPDPEFPTVKYPNPEEKGALDLAMAHADSLGVRIVLANDPDADRFEAAEKITSNSWRMFTGDQIGSLLGSWALERYKASERPIDKLAMCASTVSSKMLAAMAEKEGFQFRETLTGFKYLGNEALSLERKGYHAEFAFEEAIGFMINRNVRDKDGVTALACFAELASDLYSKGDTLTGHLDALYKKYGFFATRNSYFRSPDPSLTDKAFHRLRYPSIPQGTLPSDPIKGLDLPKTMGSFPVTAIRDLTIGYDSENPPTFEPSLPVSGASHMITIKLGGDEKAGDVVLTMRTSGTEPKIKYYIECSGTDRDSVQEKLIKVENSLGEDWLRYSEFGLQKA